MNNKNTNNDTTRLIETGNYITTAYGTLYYYKCEKCGYDEILDGDGEYCSRCGRKVIY
jgi:hypothetical protein